VTGFHDRRGLKPRYWHSLTAEEKKGTIISSFSLKEKMNFDMRLREAHARSKEAHKRGDVRANGIANLNQPGGSHRAT
jgi:hypothetical protein